MQSNGSYKEKPSRTVLERLAKEGDIPVYEGLNSMLAYESSTELVEHCVKMGGPPSKAKYYPTTDSEK